ncbi:UNVERIFIED_CONTAM: hypothetical protein Slati_4440000 [Sesamum latifolium]|uniref:Uncharacterized protein n=1 Tax=Sesamum latifolium TaxID=2727402 RepID=A0AAW2SQQ9_9LAMI
MLRLRHLRENLEELDREFGRLAVNAQVAGQVQRVDLDIVQTTIRNSLVASTALWNALQETIRKAPPSVMTRELREQGSKPALRVQDSKPVSADSSTACTRPSPDSGETATIESQGVQTSDDSSQPSTSGVKEGEISLRPMTGTSKASTNELIFSSSAWQVYQRMWKKLISRKGVNPSKTIIKTSKKYNRVWMLEGSKPEDVRKWYDFGVLASVHTMSPSFLKISKLPEWISGAVYDSWQNNPHLKRGDILELKFISAAPEMAGKGSHPAFYFIKLQRPDMVASTKLKPPPEKLPWYQQLVKRISLPEELGVYGSVSPRWTKIGYVVTAVAQIEGEHSHCYLGFWATARGLDLRSVTSPQSGGLCNHKLPSIGGDDAGNVVAPFSGARRQGVEVEDEGRVTEAGEGSRGGGRGEG